MSGARGKRGRFTKGNPEAAQGGRARAATLSPERRRAIARQARAAMVRKHFGGDDGAQRAYFAALGVFNYEVQAGAFRPCSPLHTSARHPGAIQDWRARRLLDYDGWLYCAMTPAAILDAIEASERDRTRRFWPDSPSAHVSEVVRAVTP